MRRVPTKIFGVSEFFYRKFTKKHFRGREPQKSTILGLFSKIDARNFCQMGKKSVFWDLIFFWKIEEMGGYFWGCALNFFSEICGNVAPFLLKNEGDWWQTHGVISTSYQEFIFTEYGTHTLNFLPGAPNFLPGAKKFALPGDLIFLPGAKFGAR